MSGPCPDPVHRLLRSFAAAAGRLWLFGMGTILMMTVTMAQQNLVSGSGTVRYNPLEGGFFQIETKDSRVYLTPTHGLPARLRQDGLRVRFVGRLQPKLMSIHMSGQNIELERIDRE
jgi:hypothetical protein